MEKQQFRIIQRYFHEHLDSMPLPELISGYRELLVQNSRPIDTLGNPTAEFHPAVQYLQLTPSAPKLSAIY